MSIENPVIDERGDETHPAYGMARVNRVSATPGMTLYDSDIRHGRYVILEIDHGSRRRDLHHDWKHPGKNVVSIAMSEAQWGALVSSFGDGAGVPVTITRIEGLPRIPDIPFESRLALSAKETGEAAAEAYEDVQAALALVEEKPTKANLRSLRTAVEHVGPNVKFAADSLTKHTENVVTKAKADIEAMVTAHAATLGLNAADMPVLELGSGE